MLAFNAKTEDVIIRSIVDGFLDEGLIFVPRSKGVMSVASG